jgi:hypothetical protein
MIFRFHHLVPIVILALIQPVAAAAPAAIPELAASQSTAQALAPAPVEDSTLTEPGSLTEQMRPESPPSFMPEPQSGSGDISTIQAKREAEHAKRQAAWEQRRTEQQARHERRRAMSPEERWKMRRAELAARYQELRQRAAEHGVEMASTPPWDEEAPVNKMPPMQQSPDASYPPAFGDHPEWDRQQDWAQLQAVVDGMTQEERDVCTIIHRLSTRLMHPTPSVMPPPERGYGPEAGPGPGAWAPYGHAPGYRPGPSYDGYRMAPGYARAPRYAPDPYYDPRFGYGRGMGYSPGWRPWQEY